MASLITHPIVPISIAVAAGKKNISFKLALLAVVASMLPDADVLAFRFGIPYGHMLGHRGFTHSLVFAAMLAAAIATSRTWKDRRLVVFLFLFAATASHGVLDALTTGGKGVGFFIPFTPERFFFSIRPIEVSPLTARAFFSKRGLVILLSEIYAVWLPCTAFACCGVLLRKFKARA